MVWIHLCYRLKGAMMEDVPRIFEAVFACTLEVYREHLLTGERGSLIASCCCPVHDETPYWVSNLWRLLYNWANTVVSALRFLYALMTHTLVFSADDYQKLWGLPRASTEVLLTITSNCKPLLLCPFLSVEPSKFMVLEFHLSGSTLPTLLWSWKSTILGFRHLNTYTVYSVVNWVPLHCWYYQAL